MGSLLTSESKDNKEKQTKNNKSQATSKDKAVLELKVARDKLAKYQKRVCFVQVLIYIKLMQTESDCTKLHEQAKLFVSTGRKV